MTSLFKKLHININLRIQTFPPIKNLLYFLVLCGGKNKFGKNSSFSKSTRVSKSFRFIDFKRLIWDMPAKVLRIEYDPNRTAFVALICYYNGILSYIFATEDMVPGQKIYTTLNKQLLRNKGCATLLSNCVEGSFFSCLELRSGFGGVLARSAGTQAVYLKNLTYLDSVIRLPSKEEIVLKTTSLVVLGRSSNIDRKFRFFYNAGQKRRLGFRPRSRGVARNPVDHPHGGGGGRCQVTAWAKVAKNQTTRSKKKSNINILTSRKFYINKKEKKTKIMSRSLWKGFFLDNVLIRKFEKLLYFSLIQFKKDFGVLNFNSILIKKYKLSLLEYGKNYSEKFPIKIWSRRSTILPIFVGFYFLVYNGRIFKKLKVTSKMAYHKFGEFVFTKRYGMQIHMLKRKKKLKKKKKR